MRPVGDAVIVAAWVAVLAMFAAAEGADRLRRRSVSRRMQRVQVMPAGQLGAEPAVRAAEGIVYAAWLKSGQRRP